ncbi:MAG: microcystin degradation protein MlrC [Candidatus Latescibacteria bacterium]|nr:microcystin degradation protein MlrC [Candidatus Latescibacterota bacterium]
MKRVLLAKFNLEVGSFNPHRTQYDDFAVHHGASLLEATRNSNSTLAGNIDILTERADIELVPTYGAWCNTTGGLVEAEAMERLIGELLAAVEAHLPADAVCLSLHGAMAGENEADPEGRVTAAIRKLVGPVPIVAAMDLHGIISQRLVDAADALVFLHTYPHTDMRQTGQRAARLLLRQLDGQVRPTTARVSIPLLARGDELITASGRFGQAIRRCQEIEASPPGLAAGVVIGNPFTDVPDLQSNVLVTTDNNPGEAQRLALELARFMWDNRAHWIPALTPLQEAVALARETEGLSVFSDAADSTASGATGDSNAILKGLCDYSFSKRALIPLVDAPAVEAAFAAGVGAELTLALGGTVDPTRFTPIDLPVYVKSLSDGAFTTEDGYAVPPGRTAVVTSGSLTLLLSQSVFPVVGRRVYLTQGLDPAEFDLVVCKSPNGFRTHYQDIAARIVAVDVPGSTSANLKTLPFQHCVRPIFPLDEEVVPPFPLAD